MLKPVWKSNILSKNSIKNQNIQYKYKICFTLWIRNLETYQRTPTQNPGICQQMSSFNMYGGLKPLVTRTKQDPVINKLKNDLGIGLDML